MAERKTHAVTGAFGFTGRYIARRLIRSGARVITLTNSPNRPNPFGRSIEVFPYQFDEPEELKKTLQGVEVLHNTYWVRFNHKNFTFAQAVKNCMTLFSCAKEAGVQRIVHISITNSSLDSPFEYFRSKARLEKELESLGVSHAILRPAVLFGKEDILFNNIAWALRRFPVFILFGDGNYRLQPVYVDDLAEIAVEQSWNEENAVINAIGPQTFTFKGLVEEIGLAIGKKRPMLNVPPDLGYFLTRVMSSFLGDVLLTRDEIHGLMQELLYVEAPEVGKTRISEWVQSHADTLGKRYQSELRRRTQRDQPYSGY